jgi:hypothetical protein
MDQVEELLDIIEAHKMTRVTGASVMFSFFKLRVQAIQQCHKLGYEYTGAKDSSRMCAEELSDDSALLRVKRVLLDVDAVPYVPELFSARNPPKLVSIRLLVVENSLCYAITNRGSSAGTHRVVSQLPATDRHPSARPPSPQHRCRSKKGSSSCSSSQQRVHGRREPLVEKETEGEARKDNSSGPAVELTEALPLVPQGRRVVRKRKAQEIKSSGH